MSEEVNRKCPARNTMVQRATFTLTLSATVHSITDRQTDRQRQTERDRDTHKTDKQTDRKTTRLKMKQIFASYVPNLAIEKYMRSV